MHRYWIALFPDQREASGRGAWVLVLDGHLEPGLATELKVVSLSWGPSEQGLVH